MSNSSQSNMCARSKYGHQYHIMQDFVDVIIQEEKGAALIILDNEKAFDRMSHSFINKSLPIWIWRKFYWVGEDGLY